MHIIFLAWSLCLIGMPLNPNLAHRCNFACWCFLTLRINILKKRKILTIDDYQMLLTWLVKRTSGVGSIQGLLYNP